MRRREFIAGFGVSAVVGPCGAWGQQALPVIGFLSSGRREAIQHYIAAFKQGLSDKGLVEGQNVAIEFRYAEGRLERLASMVVDLVRREVSVILASGGSIPVLVAKGATATIPIVFTSGYDPVRAGIVSSLNRPQANVTGITVNAGPLGAKRLELLRELMPSISSVAIIQSSSNPNSALEVGDLESAARKLNLRVRVLDAGNPEEIHAAYATAKEAQANAVVVNPDPVFLSNRTHFITAAIRHSLPTIYYAREYVDAGGLVSYGASFSRMYREAGTYVARILRGEKPSDLPIVQPTTFEFVINLKGAKALGVPVSPMLLARADEVIE